MFTANAIKSTDKPGFYRELCDQLQGLLAGESNAVANAANMSALMFDAMADLNWVGFYFLDTPDELVVGPFQGKPACVRIPLGKGVCGTAATSGTSILVEDVNAFSGHIFCDPVSRSELVVPLIRNGRTFGVVDIDSPTPGRFDADDQAGVEQLAAIYVTACDCATSLPQPAAQTPVQPPSHDAGGGAA